MPAPGSMGMGWLAGLGVPGGVGPWWGAGNPFNSPPDAPVSLSEAGTEPAVEIDQECCLPWGF